MDGSPMSDVQGIKLLLFRLTDELMPVTQITESKYLYLLYHCKHLQNSLTKTSRIKNNRITVPSLVLFWMMQQLPTTGPLCKAAGVMLRLAIETAGIGKN